MHVLPLTITLPRVACPPQEASMYGVHTEHIIAYSRMLYTTMNTADNLRQVAHASYPPSSIHRALSTVLYLSRNRFFSLGLDR